MKAKFYDDNNMVIGKHNIRDFQEFQEIGNLYKEKFDL